MRKRLVLLVAIILLLVAALYGTYRLMNSRTYQLFGEITDKVETKQKVVALTFDDGPTDQADHILSLLKKYHIKATFFLIGKDIEQNPEDAKKLVEAGHQIGNHTYSHNRMVLKSPSFIKQEIEKTDQLIRQSGYTGKIDFRPPNGKKLVGLPLYLSKHDRQTITWNLEPDTFYTDASAKVSYVEKHVKPGSIILIHPWYDKSGSELATIEGIIKSLTKKGYQFVTIDELQKYAK